MKFYKIFIFSFIESTIYGISCGVDVWLTVSSRVTFSPVVTHIGPAAHHAYVVKQRFLELNWRKVINDENHWIGLFNFNVGETVMYSKALLVIQPENCNGNYRTEIQFPVYKFHERHMKHKCLGFYIVYAEGNKVIAKNCIKLKPKWMEENFDIIRDRRISDLMIPGTHDTGSYYEGYQKTGAIQSAIDKYAICQDENIFNQLMFGIRYLDLRVMYSPNVQNGETHDFWMAHDTFRMDNTLATVLKDVRKFMDATSKEVVIVDFHRFPYGFDTDKAEKHGKLLQLIEQYLGPYLSSNSYYDVTVGKLVNSGKRVIVGYAEHEINRTAFLYPRVRQLWAETDDIVRLHEYFGENLCLKPYPYIAEAAMGELTPQVTGVIFDTYGGLRKLADNVNGYVTEWFRDEWLTCANIIATDFFLGNNIIEVSINSLKQIQ